MTTPMISRHSRRSFQAILHKYWQLYVIFALPLLYILIFKYVHMAGLQIAFKKFDVNLGIWDSPWVGIRNVEKFLRSYQFKRVLVNTLRLSFYQLLAGFPIPIVFALLLNSVSASRLKKTVQTITYMPHFISTVVLVGMIVQMMNPRIGLYGYFYRFLNQGSLPADLLASASMFPHLYVWSGVWQQAGWNSIIYMAALSTVSPELHEAATIDGANMLRRVIYIDLPSILPIATILLILRTGQIMNVGFEKAFLMQNSLNLRTSEIIATYVYKVGLASLFGVSDFSYATAIGLFNSLINLALIVVVNRAARLMSGNSLW